MIRTRFSGEITILEDLKRGWYKVKTDEGNIRTWHISEFEADNGLPEIQKAIDNLKKEKN